MPDLSEQSTPATVLIVVAVVLMLALAVVFFVRFIRTFRLVRNQLMPLGGKVAFWATLAYLVLPVDVLPDPLLIDDIALLAAAASYITSLARSRGIGQDGDDANPPGDDDPSAELPS